MVFNEIMNLSAFKPRFETRLLHIGHQFLHWQPYNYLGNDDVVPGRNWELNELDSGEGM